MTPLVEPLSLDEAYLDVTENAWEEPLGVNVAKRLKADVREATGLTVSAGVAPNKFLAKIASGWKKPDGLTVIAPERVAVFLEQLPIDALWGVGPKTAQKLRAAGLTRLTDVRAADPARLREVVGSLADWLLRSRRASTIGRSSPTARASRAARSERSRKTSSTSTRFARKWRGWRSEPEAGSRRALFARTVTLKVRYHDFTTITRSHSEKPATRDAARLIARAVALLDRTDAGTRPVRLLGVSVHGLCEEPGEEPVRVRRPGATLPFEEPG